MSKRVLIVGRGVAGSSLAEDVRAAGEVVIGFLDDFVRAPDVLGGLEDVGRVCAGYDVEMVYFAIPTAGPELLREFVSRLPRPGPELAIVPRTYRIVSRDRVSVADLTDVDILDLVGRAPVKHDLLSARQALAGRRVLVTGAGGSIGSRLVAQLAGLEPELVVGVDRSEPSIFRLGQELQDSAAVRLEVGDVQSAPRMTGLMRDYRPDVVFHVAAYKHVPLMQQNPIEAFNNNVGGTLTTMRAAAAEQVDAFVYVSTDKAVHPTNVMGATKRVGELLLRDMADIHPETRFVGVRFGNVLESEGSVMQTFRRQLQHRRNLTVTHPDITRYFMTIDEAAQLVIQSAVAGRQKDLFVLDMGEPIRVMELAESLIAAVDPSLGIDIIGLRPGEKMYEELSYHASAVDSTTHPKIFIVTEQSGHEAGEAREWAERLLPATSAYSMSPDELREELRAFGFGSLQ